METDKAALTVESAFTGTLAKIERQAGETVEAGTVIAYLLTAGGGWRVKRRADHMGRV